MILYSGYVKLDNSKTNMFNRKVFKNFSTIIVLKICEN